MTRADVNRTKVHYRGSTEDFIVFLDSAEDYQKWLADRSVPLTQVVSSFKVFTTRVYVLFFFFFGPLLFCLSYEMTRKDERMRELTQPSIDTAAAPRASSRACPRRCSRTSSARPTRTRS